MSRGRIRPSEHKRWREVGWQLDLKDVRYIFFFLLIIIIIIFQL